MSVTNAYCTVEEVRAQLTDTNSLLDTTLIEKAINAASRGIDAVCGFPKRKFWLDAEPTTRTYRPSEPDIVWITDIGDVDGLVIQIDSADDGSWATTWNDTDYKLEPAEADLNGEAFAFWRIVATASKAFPIGSRRRSLRVTARHGWSRVPDAVNQAAILKAVAIYRRKDAPFGVAGFGEFGAVRITRRDTDVVDLLMPYVRGHVLAV